MLDLVDDYESTEGFQRERGFIQPGQVARILKVEVTDVLSARGQFRCEGRLPHLPGTEKRDYGIVAQLPAHMKATPAGQAADGGASPHNTVKTSLHEVNSPLHIRNLYVHTLEF